ncbi:MAG: TVP38/TMEM64 family protein [Proteobacteria bacterium]|nr:TVP38/TMEM64 family protein [Pseudomonadota bacterium]
MFAAPFRTFRAMPWLRLLPLLLLIGALAAALWLGLPGDLSWHALAERQAALTAAAAAHPASALAAYVGLYALIAALSIPATTVMSAAGGLLFGTVLGSIAAVAGATLGAVLLFLIVRAAFRPLLARRLAPVLARIGPALERDGFGALLALRLVPLFPFWLVNLAPALVGMRLLPFAAATLLGIVPASVVLVSVGAGLGGVLAAGGEPDLTVLVSPRVLLPLAGLALLSLLPTLWRRWRGRVHA